MGFHELQTGPTVKCCVQRFAAPTWNLSININISRYGWGYGMLSGVTIFAVCVLFTHAIMVLAYAGYSIFLAIRHKPVTYMMLTDVGELVVMSLGSRPTPQLSAGKELP